MVMHIKEAHAFFLEENTDVRIGLSKFSELRPPHVLLNSQIPMNVCVCVYHENFIQAVDALHKVFPSIPPYSKNFPGTCLISPTDPKCWFSTCDNVNCGFQYKYPLPDDNEDLKNTAVKWLKWQDTNVRLQKIEESGTVE